MAGYDLETDAGRDARRLVTVIADPGPAREQAVEAVRVAGATAAAMLEWQDLAAADAAPVWPGIVLAAAEGIDDDMLAAALPWLESAPGAAPTPVVMTLDPTQIDLVTATLLDTHVQLLCDASLTDCVTALALAAAGSGAGVADSARAAATERLRRLGDEVARVAETLTALARQEERGGRGVGDRTGSYGTGPGVVPPLATTAGEVRGAIRSRRLRDAEFAGIGWFEDPAWDMLLDLFAAELEGAQVAVSSLCIAAAVAPTTALRWITRMTEAGLLRRAPDPADRRRAFIALTDSASAAMRRYCDAVRRAGLGIA